MTLSLPTHLTLEHILHSHRQLKLITQKPTLDSTIEPDETNEI